MSEVAITRDGKAVARLEPVDDPPGRTFGVMNIDVPDEVWFEPLPDEDLARWE